MVTMGGSLSRQNNGFAAIAGGAAGNLTVTGITTSDTLVAVLNLTAGGNLTSEFTITATNTINNALGTDTTGLILLVVYQNVN